MDYLALTGSDLDNISPPGFAFKGGTIGQVVGAAVPYVFYLAGFALAVYIVFSGFSLITSKGDERALAAAKAKLTYAITGFLIVFSSYWIVQIIGRILNIQKIIDIFG